MRQFRVFCALLLLSLLPVRAAASEKAAAAKKAPRSDLALAIDGILGQPQMASAHWGIDIVDLESGKVIYSREPDHLFTPASNNKLVTTAAALALIGPDYRFQTSIESTSNLDSDGRLHGDLVIVGRGDPNISGRVMPYQLKTQRISPPTHILEQLADLLVQKGLKIVDGDVIGDDTFYSPERYGEGWALDDLQWLDGAPVTALTVNDNVVFVRVQPGLKAGDKALINVDPESTYYELDNRIVTVASGSRKVGMHREPGSYKITMWGRVPLNDAGFSEALSIEDPASFTAQLFLTFLQKRGVTVTGKPRARHGDPAQFTDDPQNQLTVRPPNAMLAAPPSQVLAEHVSLPFLEDLRITNKTSQNLHAELALRLLGRLKGTAGSFEGGAAVVRQFLNQIGIKNDEFFLLDGSGLSRRDLITPAAMIQLLVYAARQPWGPAYEETLPVAGVDGSLAERFLNTPAGGLVHAKTGTLSHVNALSGYGQTKSGKRFVFSIFCNHHNTVPGRVLAAIDSIVVAVVTEGESVAKPPVASHSSGRRGKRKKCCGT